MDGEISKADLIKALELAKATTEKVYQLQVKALKKNMLLIRTRIKMIVNKETIAELAKENKRLDNRNLTNFVNPS